MGSEVGVNNRWSQQELFHLLFTGILLGFIMSFKDWGSEVFDVAFGIRSLIICILLSLFLLLVRVIAQKYVAKKKGYRCTYGFYPLGSGIGLFITFLSNGFLSFAIPGKITLTPANRLRLGTFRRGPNILDFAIITLAGTLVPLLFMILIKPIYIVTQSFILEKFILIAGAITVYSLLPLPRNDGFHIFYVKRWLWVFVFAFACFYFALIIYAGIFSYIIATVLALIVTFIYVKEMD